jgi:uncharacterized damage-inducible protein DinB
MHDGIQFSDLLAYTEAEHARWKQFFAQHPGALDLPCDVASSGTIRELVFHIFVVNLFFAHRLLGLDLLDFKTLPHSSLEELFAVDEGASRKLRTFLENVRPEDWETKLPLGFIDRSVSKRKMLSQAMLHGVHHRAQLATALRQQGLKQDWKHDLILSDVME